MDFIVAADDFRLYIRNQAPLHLCDLRHKGKELSCRAPGLGWVLETFNHPVACFPFNFPPPPTPPPLLPLFESRREDLYLSKRQINRNKRKKKKKKKKKKRDAPRRLNLFNDRVSRNWNLDRSRCPRQWITLVVAIPQATTQPTICSVSVDAGIIFPFLWTISSRTMTGIGSPGDSFSGHSRDEWWRTKWRHEIIFMTLTRKNSKEGVGVGRGGEGGEGGGGGSLIHVA